MTPSQQHKSQPHHQINSIAPSESPVVSNPVKRPIWEVVAEIGSQISDQEWAEVPSDGSIQYKHYIYGAPRKNS